MCNQLTASYTVWKISEGHNSVWNWMIDPVIRSRYGGQWIEWSIVAKANKVDMYVNGEVVMAAS